MIKKADSGRVRMIKKAAACALALAFLLSACGMAKSENAPTEGVYSTEDAGSGTYSSYTEDGYDSAVASEESMDVAGDMDFAAAEASSSDKDAEADTNTGSDQADLASENRKIVYTGNVSLQSLEYDTASKSIHDKITQYGGFIESENSSNNDPYWYYTDRTGSSARRTRRNLSITARIPAEQFDAFMEDLKNDGQVINSSVNAQNISVSYANHDASRKALEIEQERLLKMMDKAESIEEMIAVEERLTQVERELGNEKTTLSAMDRDVNFSTVYINLEEVFEYSQTVVETTFGERLKRAFNNAIEGFVEFWEELILFIVETFPFLIMLAIIIAIVVKLTRRGHRRRMERRAAWEESRRAAGAAGAVDGTDPGAAAAWEQTKKKARRKGLFGRRKDTDKAAPAQPVMPAQPAGAPVQQNPPAQPVPNPANAPAASEQPVPNPANAPAASEQPTPNPANAPAAPEQPTPNPANAPAAPTQPAAPEASPTEKE